MSRGRRRLPTCTATVLRGDRAGDICGRPAWLALATRYEQGFVCGNHRRAWLPSALFELVPLEADR